jgi:hypothetical protein
MNLALAGFINDLDWDLMLENLDHYTTTLQNLYDIATAVVGGIYDFITMQFIQGSARLSKQPEFWML